MNRHAVGLLALAVAGTAIAQAQQPSAALATYLRDNIGFTPAQIAAMERGEVVVKVLPSTNDRDVVVFGIVTAPVSRAAYVAIAKNFRTSLAGPNRPQLGIFSDPPVAADLQSLVVSKDEAADLEKCKPGDCAMKLPLADMRTLHAQIRWASPTLSADVSAFARKRFLEYATDYRQRGDAAMAVFADRGNVSARAAFADILDDSPYVYQHVPSVTQYLIAYPRGRLPDATEVLYWSQDILPRLRPIISIT
ncbi:MAG TPA: hypothetical protein VE967_09000, partial [Gemmatimonadaceae bacterium]|nr:hypothetical protein [Gemmatimonadaceae bacterium]